jgi:hypothetical protein
MQMHQLSNNNLQQYIGWTACADGSLIPPKEDTSAEPKSLVAKLYEQYQTAAKVVSWVGDTMKQLYDSFVKHLVGAVVCTFVLSRILPFSLILNSLPATGSTPPEVTRPGREKSLATMTFPEAVAKVVSMVSAAYDTLTQFYNAAVQSLVSAIVCFSFSFPFSSVSCSFAAVYSLF